MMATSRSYVQWRYPAGGRTRHAIDQDSASDPRAVALCGRVPGLHRWAAWWGTGDQDEYERTASLPSHQGVLWRNPDPANLCDVGIFPLRGRWERLPIQLADATQRPSVRIGPHRRTAFGLRRHDAELRHRGLGFGGRRLMIGLDLKRLARAGVLNFVDVRH